MLAVQELILFDAIDFQHLILDDFCFLPICLALLFEHTKLFLKSKFVILFLFELINSMLKSESGLIVMMFLYHKKKR